MTARVTRRSAIQFTAALAWFRGSAVARGKQDMGTGYGRDPSLLEPRVTWALTLDAAQLAVCRALCDVVLPADGPHPSAAEVGVHDFLNEWLSAPYPEMRDDRSLFESGIRLLDDRSRESHGRGFAALDRPSQIRVFDAVLAGNDSGQAFGKRAIDLIAGGYYTTAAGFEDLGYKGNVARTEFPAVAPDVQARLQREIEMLTRRWPANES